jgi:uncharacterized protein YgfB (UPF0149 family)
MNPTAPPSYDELQAIAERLQLGVGASDLHGSLCGFLCAGGQTDREHWLDSLALEVGVVDADASSADRRALARLYDHSLRQLEDTGGSFMPMLPDDDSPVERRLDALVEWCRGFMGGLGLADLDRDRLDQTEAGEILQDFGRIAGGAFDLSHDDEEDESALTEVIEYVRVSVLLLQTELPAPAAPRTMH